jgi:hypothetical protein
MKEQKSIVMCIMSGQGERCVDDCPLYKKCWDIEQIEQKKNA